jgi:hypothetical protein
MCLFTEALPCSVLSECTGFVFFCSPALPAKSLPAEQTNAVPRHSGFRAMVSQIHSTWKFLFANGNKIMVQILVQ